MFSLYDAGSNDALEYLDLSWNHIRRKGAIEIANGLRVTLGFLNYCSSKQFNLFTLCYVCLFVFFL